MSPVEEDEQWIPFRYRGFYDRPLVIHLRWRGMDLLLDRPFDEALDDYTTDYSVLRLAEPPPDLAAWGQAIDMGVVMGRIPVDSVRFDETFRRAIDRRSIERQLAAL